MIVTCGSTIYTMDQLDCIASTLIENYIGLRRVLNFLTIRIDNSSDNWSCWYNNCVDWSHLGFDLWKKKSKSPKILKPSYDCVGLFWSIYMYMNSLSYLQIQ